LNRNINMHVLDKSNMKHSTYEEPKKTLNRPAADT
jgi:hypothetical protein